MVRQPDVKNKSNRLVFIPLSNDEKEIAVAFKKLVIQDETTLHDFLLEAIILHLQRHNIVIGGNPNHQLLRFTDQEGYAFPKCKCGKDSVSHGLHLASNREYDFCKKCFSEVLGRYDKKLWQWSNSQTANCISGRSKE